MKLKTYMEAHQINNTSMAKNVGRTRQNIENWIKDGAVVELTEAGLRIRLSSGFIAHETQVKK